MNKCIVAYATVIIYHIQLDCRMETLVKTLALTMQSIKYLIYSADTAVPFYLKWQYNILLQQHSGLRKALLKHLHINKHSLSILLGTQYAMLIHAII